jgi:polyhydroxybutyrate depolymerase
VRHLLTASLVLAVTAVGLVASPGPASALDGTYSGPLTLEHDGLDRTYRTYVPASYDGSEAVPLVVGLHGGCGSANQFAQAYGWREQADEDGFIVVMPQGTAPGPCNVWNAGRCCPDQPPAVDDVGFLVALIDHVEATYEVDADRVLATGMSNGAVMSYRLACEAPDRITMIGPVEGSQEVVPPCTPSQPVSALVFHGDADTSVPFEGGVGDGLVDVDWHSVPSALETWRSLDGCDRTPSVAEVDGVERSHWSGCTTGATVDLVRIDDNPHAWPGADGTTVSGNTPSQKVHATSELAAALLASDPPADFPDHGFPDVVAAFDPGVTWLAMQGITTGYDDGTFRTGTTVNRQQVAAFLFRMVGDPTFEAPATPTFHDVSPDHPFFREVEWLASSGITTGWSDGTFRPASPLSRSAFATQLWRVAGEPTAGIPAHPFADVGANDAVDWMAAAGITTGYPDGTFRPAGTLNRGQVATFLHRLAGTHWA